MASGNTLGTFGARDGVPPGSNYATQDTRNNIPVLDFDATTEETILFGDALPDHYGGGGITVDVWWMATSATTGAVVWGGSIERENAGGTDLDSDSFATEQLASAVNTDATSGKGNKSTITFTAGANMDSLVAGEPYRLKIARKPADAGDTMSGDAEIYRVKVRET